MRKDKLVSIVEKIIGRRIAVVYARTHDYKKKVKHSDKCPFCFPEKGDIVHKGKNWLVIKNKYPYPKHKSHLLMIPKRHITRMTDLVTEELMEYALLYDEYAMEDNMVMGRVYPFAGASVAHLHIHFISDKIGKTNQQ